MAYYQCFKTVTRTVYCSSYTVKNHVEGASWVGLAMAHYGIQANELLGKPYEKDQVPAGAIEYP